MTVTERVNDGPMRTPGNHIELARQALNDRPETEKAFSITGFGLVSWSARRPTITSPSSLILAPTSH
jgi:hypothetical protein